LLRPPEQVRAPDRPGERGRPTPTRGDSLESRRPREHPSGRAPRRRWLSTESRPRPFFSTSLPSRTESDIISELITVTTGRSPPAAAVSPASHPVRIPPPNRREGCLMRSISRVFLLVFLLALGGPARAVIVISGNGPDYSVSQTFVTDPSSVGGAQYEGLYG